MPPPKNPKPDQVNCPRCKYAGLLFDVTPRLAQAVGVKHVQCDRCRSRWAIRPNRP